MMDYFDELETTLSAVFVWLHSTSVKNIESFEVDVFATLMKLAIF